MSPRDPASSRAVTPWPPVRRRPTDPILAIGVGIVFVLSAMVTRAGLHNEVNPITTLVWLGLGLSATRVATGRWLPPLPRWPGAMTLFRWSGVVVVAAGWVLGCVVILGPPNDPHAHDTRYQPRCRWQLEYLGEAIAQYAADHDGRYPDRPEALLLAGLAEPDSFVCPSTHDWPAKGNTPAEQADALASGGHLSYVYVGRGLTTAATRPSTVLMYEPARNHTRDHPGLHVLYAGDRVEFLQGDAVWQFLLDMQR